ncbi:hypothetical protein [Demequina aurantiaca]|uniref:hypothetical protein n=1 Tax=Demequina aurantiaca TaxID=676200 RepID=UPI003D328B69
MSTNRGRRTLLKLWCGVLAIAVGLVLGNRHQGYDDIGAAEFNFAWLLGGIVLTLFACFSLFILLAEFDSLRTAPSDDAVQASSATRSEE